MLVRCTESLRSCRHAVLRRPVRTRVALGMSGRQAAKVADQGTTTMTQEAEMGLPLVTESRWT